MSRTSSRSCAGIGSSSTHSAGAWVEAGSGSGRWREEGEERPDAGGAVEGGDGVGEGEGARGRKAAARGAGLELGAALVGAHRVLRVARRDLDAAARGLPPAEADAEGRRPDGVDV